MPRTSTNRKRYDINYCFPSGAAISPPCSTKASPQICDLKWLGSMLSSPDGKKATGGRHSDCDRRLRLRRADRRRSWRRKIASTVVPPAQATQVSAHDGFRILIISTLVENLGLDLCRAIRSASAMSIILLLPADRQLDGVEAGADYCLPIGTEMRQLMVHVRALLRRSELDEQERWRVLQFDGWRIDPHRRLLSAPDGSNVSLLAAEFELLIAFCRQPGTVLSRRFLLDATHIGLGRPLERSVDVHICRLRRKLTEAGNGGELIQTVRLGGYVLVARVNPE